LHVVFKLHRSNSKGIM